MAYEKSQLLQGDGEKKEKKKWKKQTRTALVLLRRPHGGGDVRAACASHTAAFIADTGEQRGSPVLLPLPRHGHLQQPYVTGGSGLGRRTLSTMEFLQEQAESLQSWDRTCHLAGILGGEKPKKKWK